MRLRYHFIAAIVSTMLLLTMAASAVADTESGSDPSAGQGQYSMEMVYLSIGLATAAALTASVSILGAGAAVGRIGSAALGSAAEHPELLTRSLLFVALAEGLAVLGFAVAMLIVMRIP